MSLVKFEASPRWINVLVGLWLIVSAFAWPHTTLQLVHALLVGASCAAIACLATKSPQARYLNVALGLWLYASGWFLPVATAATLNNHAIMSAVMVLIALVPSRRERLRAASSVDRRPEQTL
jgi:hypothetical protein